MNFTRLLFFICMPIASHASQHNPYPKKDWGDRSAQKVADALYGNPKFRKRACNNPDAIDSILNKHKNLAEFPANTSIIIFGKLYKKETDSLTGKWIHIKSTKMQEVPNIPPRQ